MAILDHVGLATLDSGEGETALLSFAGAMLADVTPSAFTTGRPPLQPN
jgi:hypothetical protein